MKQNLTNAFKELRKLGYFARQNFWCCQSCAGAAVPADKVKKVVFYHNQDNHDLRSTGECCLAWNGDAEEICKVLNKNGVKTTWDGESDHRIEININ
jgi:hypothetical protein